MQIKLGKLINIKKSLDKLINKNLPIVIAYNLSKLTRIVLKEIELFEQNRMKLINKYAEKDENGNYFMDDNNANLVKINSENIIKFNEELNELINIDVNIECEKVKLNDLSNINLSVIDLINLEDFIEE